MMGVTYGLPSATPADVWTYSTRKLSMASLTFLNAVAVACGNGVESAYVEVVAAAAVAYDGLLVRITLSGAMAGIINTILVDVAIGAAGAEVVIAPNVASELNSSVAPDRFTSGAQIFLPNVKVPAGSRLSVRGLGVLNPQNITVEVSGAS